MCVPRLIKKIASKLFLNTDFDLFPHVSDCFRPVVCLQNSSAGNDEIRAGLRALIHIVESYSAVDLNIQFGMIFANLSDFFHLFGHKFLPAESRLHRHY